jgi:hypothetical protein
MYAEPEPWFYTFAQRLLEGRPEVLKLLADNPFPDRPPRYVRALLFDYRFSNAKIRRETGAWWVTEPIRLFLPPVSLKPQELAPDFRL